MTASFPEGLVFVTSNAGKAREASHFLGRPVEARPLELAEVQSLSFEEVVRTKAVDAAARLGCPVLVDDSGLAFPAWNGFPGPFTRFALEAAGLHGLAGMAGLLPGRRAEAVAVLALARPGDSPADVTVAEGRVPGMLLENPRGTNGFGWDPLFLPDGSPRSYAEMTDPEKNSMSHRARAFAALRAVLAADGASGGVRAAGSA